MFLINFTFSYSQAILSGTIKNKQSNEALPGAIIYLPDLKTGASSNNFGYYKLNRLPKVKTLVQVKLIGFKTIVRTVDLTDSLAQNFELEESVIEEEEIVVTGSYHSSEIKKSAVPMVAIDQKFLQQNSYNNIIEGINKVAGLSAVSSGPNISKPYIRGLGINRVLTLFDGIRQDGQQWGDEHGIEIDQFLINRIEVVKGPASLIYGSDALAGVINLLPENPMPEGSAKGSLQSEFQNNNKQYAGSFNFSGNNNNFIYGVRASKKRASNYENKIDWKVFGTKYNESNLSLNTGINKSWGYSHIYFTYYDNLQEVPDGYRDSTSRKFVKQITEADTLRPIVSDDELNSYQIGTNYQRVNHIRITSSSSFYTGKSRMVMKYGFQQSLRQEFGHPQNPGLAALNLKLNTVTYDLKFHFPETKGWDADIGVNGMYQKNKNLEATEFLIPNYKSFDVGPFAYLKKTIGKLELSAGARYDVRNFENFALYTRTDTLNGFDSEVEFKQNDSTIVKQFSDYRHSFTGFSASFGGCYNFSEKFGIKMNLGRGYRAPNISEISAKGIHPGTGFLQLGDDNFKPEFNLQEDLGIFFETEHVSGSLDLFNNIISNYIYNEKLISLSGNDSVFVNGSEVFPVFKFNQTKAQLYGGEFSFDIHPHPFDWLHFENSISFIQANNLGGNGVTITDSTKYLPFIAPLHTNTELRADFKKKLGCFKEIFMKIGFQYYAAQNQFYSANGTETKTNSYHLFDAGIGANILNKQNKTLFSIMILGTNLSDQIYQSNMSRLKYFDNYPVNGSGRSGIYNMGRNFSFKLIIPLEISNIN